MSNAMYPGDQSRKAGSDLMSGEERFQLLMECVRDFAIFLLDLDGRVMDWNLGAEAILGYSQSEIVGRPFSTFFTPEESAAGVPEQELKRAAATGRSDDNRWHVRKNGTHFFANGVTTALRDEAGDLKAYAKVLRDNTEKKRLEEELRARADALADADRRKDDFLALLAHELRNPLSPLFNALTLLGQENVPDSMKQEALGMMQRQARLMARLVDDLLDLSRINSGKLSLQRKPSILQTIAEHAVETARPLIENRRHLLELSLAAEPICINADRSRLQQVIGNILNNAAKYSDDGSRIRLSIQKEGNQAVIRIRDTGLGIAPDMLPQIFEMYTQADRSLDVGHYEVVAGTGIRE